MSVLAPVLHVGGLGDVHIAEGGMTAVGGTAEHHELVIDLPGEQYAVSVEGQEGVLALIEGLEIVGVADADGGFPAVGVAPGHPVSVLDPAYAGIVAVAPLVYFLGGLVGLNEYDAVGSEIPVDAVLGEAGVELHVPCLVVNAEHARELAVIGNYCAVEYRVGGREQVAGDYGVGVISPYNVGAALGLVLPGHIGDRLSVDDLNFHTDLSFRYFLII